MTPTTQYYENNYLQYHEATFNIDPTSILEPLARHLPPGAHILDVGCSSGRDLLWLKNKGFKVTGLERSPGLAGLARENAGCKIIESDFNQLDFSSLQVDAILLIGVLVHTPYEEMPVLFNRITKALNNGGYVLITMKDGTAPKVDEKGRSFYLWTDPDLRVVFKKAGFVEKDFSNEVSKLGTGELWLSYVLQKAVPG